MELTRDATGAQEDDDGDDAFWASIPVVHLTAEEWQKFQDALNNPAVPSDALRKLMSRKAPWETEL